MNKTVALYKFKALKTEEIMFLRKETTASVKTGSYTN